MENDMRIEDQSPMNERIADERRARLLHTLDQQCTAVTYVSAALGENSSDIIRSHGDATQRRIAEKLKRCPADLLDFRDTELAAILAQAGPEAARMARQIFDALLQQPNAEQLLLQMYAGQPGMEFVNAEVRKILEQMAARKNTDQPETLRALRHFKDTNTPSNLVEAYAGDDQKLMRAAMEEFRQAGPDIDNVRELYRNGLTLNTLENVIRSVQESVLQDGYGKTEPATAGPEELIAQAEAAPSTGGESDPVIAQLTTAAERRKQTLERGIASLKDLLQWVRSSQT